MARGTPNFPLNGPLAPFEQGFVARLGRLGYVPGGIVGQRALVAHLDRWMMRAGLSLADLTPALVDRFLESSMRRPVRPWSRLRVASTGPTDDGSCARRSGHETALTTA